MADFYQAVDWITKSSVVPGMFFNILLIHLVRKHTRADIGTFRYLLIVFALYDIILINLHSLFDPKCLTFPGIFSCVLDFPYGSWFLTTLHYILFMNSYAILITHLLYRYWVIRKPYKIELFSNPLFIAKLIAPVVAIGALLFVLSFAVIEEENSPLMVTIREQFRLKYNYSREDGWVIADYWRDGKWNVAAIFVSWFYDVVGTCIVIVVVTLACLTYRHISAAFTLSPSTRKMQMQLLRTVCVQTFIPMVCVMIPYFINLTLPIFGITIPFITDTTGVILSFFPSWDPLAVIILMKPYRVALWTMVTRRKPVEKKSVSNATSAAFTIT